MTKKKQGGRPPVTDEDKRDVVLRLLVTEDEAESVRLKAQQESLSASSWMRSVILAAAREARR